MIFSTTSAVEIVEAMVTEDFLTLPHDYGTNTPFEVDGSDLLYFIWREASHENSASFENLTISECQSSLSVKYIHNYSAFLFFTNASSAVVNATLIEMSVVDYTDNLLDYMYNRTANSVIYLGYGKEFEVTYCLALKTRPSCTIELVPALLGVVIACNLIKIVVLLNILYLPVTRLRTIGDAIASFMDSRDPFTKKLNVITAEGIATVGQKHPSARRYFSGASRTR